MVNIGNDWDALLEKEFEQPYYKQLRTFLAAGVPYTSDLPRYVQYF